MPTQQDVTQQLLQAFSIAEPALDASIGSPIRSIFDVVAEAIAEAYADVYLLSYQNNVDTKSGSDLDSYVAQFGFTRNPGQRATGSVTFSRTSPATADVYIAAGTQVADTNTPPDIFNTLTPCILAVNTTSISVPIQAQIAGTAGNVLASTITQCTSLQMGFSSVTNANALTGGTDQESDDQLRARFKATVFRALTGTQAMFEAVGLDDPNVTKVNVIGSAKQWNEMVQIVSGSAYSSVPDLKYFYQGTETLGTDIFNGVGILTQGVDYIINIFELNCGSPSTTLHSTGGNYGSGHTLVYEVTAVNASGESLPGGATTPVTTAGTGYASCTLNTSGLDTPGATSYNIYLSFDSGSFGYIGTVQPGQDFLDEGNVAPNGTPPTETEAIQAPVIQMSTSVIQAITGITVNSGTSVTLDIPSTAGIVNADTVVVAGVTGGSGINGTWSVASFVTDTSITVTTSAASGSPSASGTVTSDAPPDGIYQLQFNYLPACSRNDPNVGITNRVDIFCNGSRQIEAVQDSTWINTNVFNDNSGDPLNIINYVRLDGEAPTAGNYFIPLYFTPIIAASTTGTIQIGANTYSEGVDYYTINNITAFGLAPQSACGIEWVSAANGGTNLPTNGVAVTYDYYFNQVPTSVQIAVQNWGLVTTDVVVHQAKVLLLNFYLGIVLANASYSQATVLTQIGTAIGTYLSGLTYDSVVQVSEIISLVQQVPGVTAVRLLTSADNTLVTVDATGNTNPQADGNNYGIQAVNDDNQVVGDLNNQYALYDGSVWRAIDVPLNDDTLPFFNSVYAAFMAPNTFGSV